MTQNKDKLNHIDFSNVNFPARIVKGKLHNGLVYPNILESHDAYCYTHKCDYVAETHQLPCGKTYVTECSRCEEDKLELQRKNDIKKALELEKNKQSENPQKTNTFNKITVNRSFN